MLRLWFGFSGRINRAKYWLVTLVNFALLFLALAAAFSGNRVAMWIFLLVLIVTSVSACSVASRRLHDRDKSGAWVLLFYLAPVTLLALAGALQSASVGLSLTFGVAAYVPAIWGFVELGCLRGTAGPNRFGEDPVSRTGAMPLGAPGDVPAP